MKQVATAPPQERALVFREVADVKALIPALIEKDFWVCWTLERLFGLPEIAPHLLFKGGTTLSKVYNVIERFSEDIDISVSRAFVCPSAADAAEDDVSKTRRRKEIETLVATFHQIVADVIQPRLREAIAKELGSADGWSLERDEQDAGTLHFTYPGAVEEASPYNRPTVKIEMGGRSDVWPEEKAILRAYAAEVVPQVFTAPNVAVHVLAVERTFWEKATLLHSEYHRPPTKGRGDRISRHYYDLTQLSRHPEFGPRCKAAREVLQRVVEHKSIYFSDSWSRYEEAGAGQMRLAPPPEAIADLRSDYARMRGMFFSEPPAFDEILEELTRLEVEVNRGSA